MTSIPVALIGAPYTYQLPLSSRIPFQVIDLKDIYGAAAGNPITIQTQGADTFEDGTTTKLLTDTLGITSVYAGQPGIWSIIGGTKYTAATIGFLNAVKVSSVLIGDGGGLQKVSGLSTVAFFGSNTSNSIPASLPQVNLSTAAQYTSNTSNWIVSLSQQGDPNILTVGTFASNTSNWIPVDNWSTPLSTVAKFMSNSARPQNWSAAISSVAKLTSNTSNWIPKDNWSSPISTVSLFTSNSSNWSFQANQDWSTPLSNLSNYWKNTIQDWSTPTALIGFVQNNTSNWISSSVQDKSTSVSTVAKITSNASNIAVNYQLDFSTFTSSVAAFTSNTSNRITGYQQDWSTPLSTVAQFTSNTSNWNQNVLQDWSTPNSTVAAFTSNTSNAELNWFTSWSTPVSTGAAFTSNTSNWFRSYTSNWSTPVSTVGQFTSNSSNYAVNTSNWISRLQQDWSTPTSTVGRYSSNMNTWTLPIQQNWSTPLSTVALLTSNTSNLRVPLQQDWSTPVSTIAQYTSNLSNYTVTASNWTAGLQQNWSVAVSTGAYFTSNTSNFINVFFTTQLYTINGQITSTIASTFTSTTTSTIIVGGLASPRSVAGAVLWYDAADPNGTGVQPSYGTSITAWSNKAGTTNTMTGATMTYSNDAGGPAIYMPGTQVFTNATATLNKYVFLVCRWDVNYNPPNLQYMISMNDLVISGQADFSIRASGSGLVNLPVGDGSYQWDMQGDQPYINGTLVPGTTTPSYADVFAHHNIIDANVNNANPTSRLQVGTSYNAGGNRSAQGWIKEILFYNVVLSTSNQQYIEGYLSWKWGLSSYLPAAHPYKLSAPGTFGSPTNVANCVLWLDAADSTSYTLSGTTVSAWSDKSVNKYSFTAPASSNYPTLTVNTLNGRPVFFFSGTNYLTGTVNLTSPNNFTMFMIYQASSAYTGETMFASGDTSSAPLGQLGIWAGGGLQYQNTFQYGSLFATGASVYRLVTTVVVVPATNASVYFNGTLQSGWTGGYGVNVSGSIPSVTIGANAAATKANYFTGNIAEIIIYSTALGTTDQQYVEGYLAWKWGLQTSLPTGHTYYSTAPNVVLAGTTSTITSTITSTLTSTLFQPYTGVALSTAISSIGQFTSNTSNWASNLSQNWSTTVSTVGRYSSNTLVWIPPTLQDWSTPTSTVARFSSNITIYPTNFLQNWSTPVSSVAQLTSNTSNLTVPYQQNWSTPVSTSAQFTSNTSNYLANFYNPQVTGPSISTAISTVARFTSNTSNWASNIMQDWSTSYISTAARYTSNTCNWIIPIQQDWSTPTSTVARFSSNITIYPTNFLQNWSTPVSSVAQLTSNTSNLTSPYQQNWSTVVSTSAQFTSNTSNYLANFYTPQLGTGPSISTAISTGAQFTSNTSNFYNPFVNYNASTSLVSTVPGLGLIYMSTFSGSSFGLSTGALVTSSVYGYVISSLLTYTSTLLLTAAPNNYWMVDVNGFSRSAVYYSSFATPGTATLTPSTYFGVYYNMTGTGTYTIALAATQPFSNIGKYYSFRNNSANDMIVTITGGTGITSPTTIYSSNSINIMVATTNSYVLF